MTSPAPRDRRLRRYVAVWVALGTTAGAMTAWWLTTAPWPPARTSTLGVFAVVVAAALVAQWPVLSVFAGDQTQQESLDEAAAVAAFALLTPAWAVVVMALGALFRESIERTQALKAAFNVATPVVGAAAGAATYDLLVGPSPFGLRGLGAATAALAVYITVNEAAFAGLRLRLALAESATAAFADGMARRAGTAFAAGAMGLIGAGLLVEVPLVAPLLVVPILLVRARMLQRRDADLARIVEHDRLHRTVAGASDAIALLDADARVEVFNPAFEAMTGVTQADARGAPLDDLIDLEPSGTTVDAGHGYRSVTTADGRQRTVLVERSPLEGPDGVVSGSVVVVRDVTSVTELERVRDDLVSRISHELRTPLATVSGYLETVLLRWDDLDDDDRRGLLERAHAAGGRLGRLLSTLLVHAGIERTDLATQRRRIDLVGTVREVVCERTADLAVSVASPDGPVEAFADPGHVGMIVTALLDNARTYGAPPVSIEVVADERDAVVRVRDRGQGVAPAFAEELFEPFTQSSTGSRRTAQGLGLGLAVARGLAHANGGGLTYLPERSDPGACFELRLPRRDDASHDEP
jgi:PAS domain S-box-containing protein